MGVRVRRGEAPKIPSARPASRLRCRENIPRRPGPGRLAREHEPLCLDAPPRRQPCEVDPGGEAPPVEGGLVPTRLQYTLREHGHLAPPHVVYREPHRPRL